MNGRLSRCSSSRSSGARPSSSSLIEFSWISREPAAGGLVQRRRPHLLEQLLDHRADPHDLGGLLDHAADALLSSLVVLVGLLAPGPCRPGARPARRPSPAARRLAAAREPPLPLAHALRHCPTPSAPVPDGSPSRAPPAAACRRRRPPRAARARSAARSIGTGRVHDRAHPPVGDHRPHLLAHAGDDRALAVGPSTGRPRRPIAMTLPRLRSSAPMSSSAFVPPCMPMITQPAVGGQRVDVARPGPSRPCCPG